MNLHTAKISLIVCALSAAIAAAQAQPSPHSGRLVLASVEPDAQNDPQGDTEAAAPGDEAEDSISAEDANALDWEMLNWDAAAFARRDAAKRWKPSLMITPHPNWSRSVNLDGSSSVTVRRSLPTIWESRVGMDFGLGPQLARQYGGAMQTLLSDPLSPNATADESAAAWATIRMPSLAAPIGWDKASIDARIDPANDERKIGTSLSKAVPLSDGLSMTLQNGYAITQPISQAASYYSAQTSAKLNVLGTGTAFILGSERSTADDRWLSSLSAEQKLFGGVSITGSVSETAAGDANKSLTAAFKHRW